MSKTAREALHAAMIKASQSIAPTTVGRGRQAASLLIAELDAAGFAIVPKAVVEDAGRKLRLSEYTHDWEIADALDAALAQEPKP